MSPLVGLNVLETTFFVANGVKLGPCRTPMRRSLGHLVLLFAVERNNTMVSETQETDQLSHCVHDHKIRGATTIRVQRHFRDDHYRARVYSFRNTPREGVLDANRGQKLVRGRFRRARQVVMGDRVPRPLSAVPRFVHDKDMFS